MREEGGFFVWRGEVGICDVCMSVQVDGNEKHTMSFNTYILHVFFSLQDEGEGGDRGRKKGPTPSPPLLSTQNHPLLARYCR